MTERHANVRGLPFFHAIFDVFGRDARLYSALVNGRPCGAMVVVSTGPYTAYLFGAFDEPGRRLGANTLLLWHVARQLMHEDVVSLDLGPSKPDSGAYRFKLHLGGVPTNAALRRFAPTGTIDVSARAFCAARSRPESAPIATDSAPSLHPACEGAHVGSEGTGRLL